MASVRFRPFHLRPRRSPTGSVGRLIDPHYRNPVTEEFNIGYSWALNSTPSFEAEYTHVLSLHENKTINIDQKIPDTDSAHWFPMLLSPARRLHRHSVRQCS